MLVYEYIFVFNRKKRRTNEIVARNNKIFRIFRIIKRLPEEQEKSMTMKETPVVYFRGGVSR